MIIKDFTEPEIDYLRKNCHFVGLELDLFNLRCEGYSLDIIAENLNISRDWAGKVSQRVNKKILKIL